jgi:hypothetical protein
MLFLSNGYRLPIFDNPLEQGRCQIHLIFGMKNRNILKIITKNLLSILDRIGCRNRSWGRVGRIYPVRIVDPGKKVSLSYETFPICWMINPAGRVDPKIAQPGSLLAVKSRDDDQQR